MTLFFARDSSRPSRRLRAHHRLYSYVYIFFSTRTSRRLRVRALRTPPRFLSSPRLVDSPLGALLSTHPSSSLVIITSPLARDVPARAFRSTPRWTPLPRAPSPPRASPRWTPRASLARVPPPVADRPGVPVRDGAPPRRRPRR